MKVLFINNGKSFLPELPAYVSYLSGCGFEIATISNEKEAIFFKDFDVVFRFGGLLRKVRDSSLPEIHEYHSASTTSLPRLKNMAKSFISCKPVGRVFLNSFVKSQYSFLDDKPYLYREMGADRDFLNIRNKSLKTTYDVVYAGSISGRAGLIEKIEMIANKGIRVGVAGNASIEAIERMSSFDMIDYVGCLDRKEVHEFLSAGRYGLNYCPDIYPLKYQTSTKVIEYLVAGLPIISNSYSWIDMVSKNLNFSYLDLDYLTPQDFDTCIKSSIISRESAESLTWEAILEDVNFSDYIKSLL